MKKKIIYGLLFAVAMVTASSSFVSCKDYEGDDYAQLKEQNAALEAFVRAQIAAIKQCDCDPTLAARLAAIEADYAKATGNATQDWVNGKNFTTLDDVKTWVNQQGFSDVTMDAVQNWVNQQGFSTLTEEQVKSLINTMLIAQVGENNSIIADMISTALANGENPYWTKNDVINYFTNNQQDLSGYATKEDINNLRNYILLGDSVKNAYMWADYSYQYIIAHRDSFKILSDSIDKVAAQATENFNIAKNLADSAIVLANQAIDAAALNSARISDLETAMKDADAKLQEQITDLEKRVAANEVNIDNILGTLKKQITGVIIQGAYSPVLGYGALPFGVQTNLLAAYAGKATAAVEFPTADAGLYADLRGEDDVPAISVEDYNYLNGLGLWPAGVTVAQGEYFVSEAEDNAGKLYLTVNPTKLDFTGTQFKLVNSQGKEVKVELSAIRPSDEVMHFGWTRGTSVEAPSANGFYEVNAQITKENVADMQPNIKKEVIVNAAKKVIKEHTKTSVKDLARALFSGMQNVLQRNAVEASWFDETLGENRAYTSEYAIAAAAVHPLGFSFLKDVNVPKTRYTQLPKFTKQLIADSLHINIDIKKLEVTTAQREDGTFVILVEIPQLDLDPQAIDVYTDAEGNVTAMYYGYPIYRDADGYWRFGNIERRNGYAYLDMTRVFEELFGRFNDAFAGLNTLDTQFNGKIDNIVDQVNYYINKYNSIADRVNNAINSLPVRINNMLQPVLLYQSAKGFSRMSASFLATTHLRLNGQAEGEISILPTSYSLELLAPSYKKSLLVTNVYKTVDGKVQSAQGVQGDLEAALKDLNGQLADYACFSSYTKGAKLQVKKKYAGMTFEIAYTAVDYNGKVAGRKFYFTVAE